ncbi:MAG: dTDP-glucose 4,6-dehydratase, partial [Candidatus Fermentibacteria bacterium]
LEARSDWEVTVLDKLTYAGRRENLEDLETDPRFTFIQGDICDEEAVSKAMEGCDTVVNFAAETHVDRSIDDASSFVRTDVEGVRVLLEAFRKEDRKLFLQISTDEVYGSVEKGESVETDQLAPRSPYAASKAGGELLAMSYWTTYGVPVIVTRASNNYGPFQYPEKLIPLFITNAMTGEPLPLYGDGLNKRDWLFVEDNCRALIMVIERSRPGMIYNIGAGQEHTNREVTSSILEITGADRSLVKYIEDRPGHDRRYALNAGLIENDIGWKAKTNFDIGLRKTIDWYSRHTDWWQKVKSGEFREYYLSMYQDRLTNSRDSE